MLSAFKNFLAKVQESALDRKTGTMVLFHCNLLIETIAGGVLYG